MTTSAPSCAPVRQAHQRYGGRPTASRRQTLCSSIRPRPRWRACIETPGRQALSHRPPQPTNCSDQGRQPCVTTSPSSPHEMSAPTTYSPSPSNETSVVADWLAHNLEVRVHLTSSVSMESIYRAHRQAVPVDDVQMALRQDNGLRQPRPAIRDSGCRTIGFRCQLPRPTLSCNRPPRTAWAMLTTPSSGFHHSTGATARACTFNGLDGDRLMLKALGLAAAARRASSTATTTLATAPMTSSRRSVSKWIGHWSYWRRPQAVAASQGHAGPL